VGFVIQASEHSSKRIVNIDEETVFIGAAGGDLHRVACKTMCHLLNVPLFQSLRSYLYHAQRKAWSVTRLTKAEESRGGTDRWQAGLHGLEPSA